MADPNYQPQQQNLYGFSNGIPGIVGGSSTSILQQARLPSAPVMTDGASLYGGEVAGGSQSGPTTTPEQSAFFDSESASDRDSRMGKIDAIAGRAVTAGAGMLTGTLGSFLTGFGTGTGLGGWAANAVGLGRGQEASTEQTASAYGQGGPSTGVYGQGAPAAGILGDSNAFGGAPATADQAGAVAGTPTSADAVADGFALGGGGAADVSGGYGGGFDGEGEGSGGYYAAGGLVTPTPTPPMQMPPPGGAPTGKPGLAAPGAPGAPTDPRMVDAQVNNLMATKPETVRKLQMAAQQAIQSGETTPEQIQQLGQIARVCLQNPAMYPKLVQMAEQRGIVQPGELPPTYNEGAVKRLILLAAVVAKSPLGQPGQPGQPGGAPIEMDDDAGEMEGFSRGGPIRGPGGPTQDAIPGQNVSTGGKVKVSNGEYIIPAKVVSIKGKEFFDNLLRKYADVSGERG